MTKTAATTFVVVKVLLAGCPGFADLVFHTFMVFDSNNRLGSMLGHPKGVKG